MKWIYSRGLAAGLLAATVSVAQAADVTITVKGKVIAKPCTITTTTENVTLEDLYTFNMVSAGAASEWHDVNLNLTNCPVGTSRVTASFSGTADSTGYYQNQGTATNIQLELQDNDGKTLNNGSSKTMRIDDVTQSTRFPLQVRALSVNGGVTQGTIQAVINVTYTWA
ncbi:S-fimbrial adhesin protein SfaS [Klebsiella spallanzanii]|uniref:S-fimbrial adhesin protein SfaS n=1 Tax=Klebsiella spallanzanii TaxID=2587528 RepID=A0ABY6VJC1_9ENTR|nr:fimbrial protein [Klebsiella spallanzanii]MDM4208611.1 fimbrial protein [Klebsiella spallanzanii]VUS85721.1 S-fimbrial adhesin protein SfaS [Klebsiella spallanzanii]